MEPQTHQRKWEILSRSYTRLNEYYLGKIDQQDSFNAPKDFVYAYFHATYSLKESLKALEGFGGRSGIVETFVLTEPSVALGIDISNTEKHGSLNDSKSGKTIGKINSHVHIFDPSGRDRTELTIEINGVKTDCLELATANLSAWKQFMTSHSTALK